MTDRGCGFEQHLEGMLKSVTPRTSELRFVGGTVGHGDGANAGFLREDSLLVVVVFGDEDDCSAADPDIFNRSSRVYTDPDLNLRCWRYEEDALYPASRYVDGLTALHPPERIVYAAIGGIPTELLEEPIDFARLVGPESERHPSMVVAPDPAMPSQLRPSCRVPGMGESYAPIRILKVAEALDAQGSAIVLGSTCQTSYASFGDSLFNAVMARSGL